MGGKTGWYFGNPLWNLRGWMDRLIGGVGLRRGRRSPTELYVGDSLDFWRVLEIDAPNRLLLLAEMKTPGDAILEFKLKDLGKGETELHQLSRFLPKGLFGLAYWYVLLPFHIWIFKGMLRTIAQTVGRPITKGPEPFTREVQHACAFKVDQK
jgi:hypothetical protein